MPSPTSFSQAERQAVYRAIHDRRDIRHYRPDPVPENVLWRLLDAAHHAPSVGFMQPWNFLLVEDSALRRRIYQDFRSVNDEAAGHYEGDRRLAYRSLKLQGLLDAPRILVVTCDTERGGPHVLGRASIRETDVYSTCLAVQNFWLAARAEGIGVGWMSLVNPEALRLTLGIPSGVIPVAVLTVGYPVEFPEGPMLEAVGWRQRLPLEEVVFADRWRVPYAPRAGAEHPARPGADREAQTAPDAASGGPPQSAIPPAGRLTRGAASPLPPENGAFPPPPSPGRSARSPERKGMQEQRGTPEGAVPPTLAPPAAAVRRQQQLTKPPGSLGRLEALALKICGIQGRVYPRIEDKVLLILAGDHGVVEERVSAYRPEITARMVYQFIAGGGAVNAIARRSGIKVLVADLGVDHDFAGATGVIPAKVRRGTRNFCRSAAMSEEEARQAVGAGRRLVADLPALDLLALGEMGIGNSTSAAALACALLGREPEQVSGHGTGIGPHTYARKVDAVRRGLALHAQALGDPWEALRRLGGFELAGLVGAIEAAAERRVPIVLDGFITSAAALAAARLRPEVAQFYIAGHVSAEPGHRQVLDDLGLEPLLDLGMRLGEGSGAALAVGLIEAAVATLVDMKTFEEAGIDEAEAVAPGGRE